METLKCPVCGEINPGDLEFCQNCQSRLQPLTGPLRGENNPIQPGQIPTKKVTSELEPILPKWLREAREKARKSSEESTVSKDEPPTTPVSPKPDLLAGLASQSKEAEEEEIPDWLAGITGSTPSKKKKPGPGDAQVKWVELGGPEDFAEPPQDVSIGGAVESPAGSLDEKQGPPWMASQKAAPESFELPDWQTPLPEQSAAPSAEGLAGPFEFTDFKNESPSVTPANDADWLSSLQTKPLSSERPGDQLPPATSPGVPDWLKNLESQTPATEQPHTEAPPPLSSSAVPDWLQPNSAAQSSRPASAPSDVPDWLKSLDQSSTVAATSTAPPEPSSVVPDWLKAVSPQPEKETPSIESKPAFTETPPAETPNWLSSLKSVQDQESKTEVPPTPVFTTQETPAQEPPAVPAFADESLPEANIDDIFASMQMPDWLSSVAPTGIVEPPPAASESLLAEARAEPSETPIAPAELPSWVQAMRPIESGLPTSPSGPTGTTLETSGPLEGLHDVLPAVTGTQQPMSKPKAHSIKLNATEEQQAQSALLEKILAAETAPIPMKSGSMVLSQRALRWFLTVVLFLFLGSSVFLGTQIFPLPNAVPNETATAMQTLDQVPADSRVLVVFDYEPSTLGEMETTAGPLLDHLLLLKHPKLILLSTSPTGPALAERLMSTILADRRYQRGTQYVDLGYLAGGLAGVNDFALNPVATMPLDVEGVPVQQLAPLQNVTRLSDFAAIIVLTDSAEAGRVWIEQTTNLRGKTPLLAVSSAQTGPMLLPYVQSGQLNGLVSGLIGAAPIEQSNNGLPGFVRRYWDAYSLGLLLAVVLIVLGGLWNLVLGVQARRAAQGQG